MTRTAIINAGFVDAVILAGVDWTAPEGITAVACGPGVGPGWSYDGEAFVAPPTPAPPRRTIPKSVVQERMNDIGKLGPAFSALNSNPLFFGRWFAPDWPNVYADDEGLLQILVAIGCSGAEIAAVTA